VSRSAPRRPAFLSRISDPGEAQPVAFAAAAGPRPVPAPAPPGPALQDARGSGREGLERLADAVAMLRLQAERLADQARADAVEIAFQAAARILETELRQSPEPLFALVRSALRRAGDSRRVVVRLSPDDARLVETDRDRLAVGALAVARVEIVADASLAPGDCVVETDFGKVDGRLATRLAEAKRAVRAAVDGGAP